MIRCYVRWLRNKIVFAPFLGSQFISDWDSLLNTQHFNRHGTGLAVTEISVGRVSCPSAPVLAHLSGQLLCSVRCCWSL